MSSLVEVDVGGVVDGLMGGLDDLFTSDEERLRARARMQEVLQQPANLQAKITLQEAKSTNWFVAGGRPALIWVSAGCLLYNWLLKDFIILGMVMAGANQETLDLLPSINTAEIIGLVVTLLGIGGLRTYEKLNGVARER